MATCEQCKHWQRQEVTVTVVIGEYIGDCYGAPPAPIVFYSGPGTFEVRFVRPQLSNGSRPCSLFVERENAV